MWLLKSIHSPRMHSRTSAYGQVIIRANALVHLTTLEKRHLFRHVFVVNE